MIYTTNQALHTNIHCPLLEIIYVLGAAHLNTHRDYSCIGRNCAMWRWTFKAMAVQDINEREGYCGLAGKPESGYGE